MWVSFQGIQRCVKLYSFSPPGAHISVMELHTHTHFNTVTDFCDNSLRADS